MYSVLSSVIIILRDSLLINCNIPFFRDPYAIMAYLDEGSGVRVGGFHGLFSIFIS